MLVLLLLLAFLDFQHFTMTADDFGKQFVVTEIDESASTGCATNPQGGGFNGGPLIVDWDELPKPATEVTTTPALPTFGGDTNTGVLQPVVTVPIVTIPPGDAPTPQTPPPVAATPEPSTVAILSITAAVLFFLLFGQRYGLRPFRRT